MATLFESPGHDRLVIVRPDFTDIAFVDGAFLAEDEADVALLRSHPTLVVERGEHAMKMASSPLRAASVSSVAPKIDVAAFPFERRTYQRGNEPFVVTHVCAGLANVADDARAIVDAFTAAFPVDARFAPAVRPQLRFVTGGARCDVGAAEGVSVVEQSLDPEARLAIYRHAHIVVRTANERGDQFELEAICAGTPTVGLNAQGDMVGALASALRDCEASYVKRSAEAARAAKQLRATAR